jgi:hypothetical protein
MEVRDGHVGMAGAPWDLANIGDLEGADIMDFALARGVLRVLDKVDELKLDGLWTKLTRSPAVLAQVAAEVESEPLDDEVLARLRKAATTPAQMAVTELLAARNAEGNGQADQAMTLIEEALRHDPGMLPAMVDAAEYAACRGDLVRADGLLRKAGYACDQHLRPTLRPLLAAPAGTTGRNQPCPCGSGEKYKKCCLGMQTHPLPARAKLLYGLLTAYAVRPANRDALELLVERSTTHAESALLDLALFNCGVADTFIEERGSWLRDDERDLLAGWCRAPLRLYEVVAVNPGQDATVRTLPGGEEIVLLDDGITKALFCEPFSVSRTRRPQMLALLASDRIDPQEIAEFFGPQPLPSLRNNEGHELVRGPPT